MKLLLPLIFLCSGLLAAQSGPSDNSETLAVADISDMKDADAAPVRKMPKISDELVDLIQYLQDSPANHDQHKRRIVAKKLDNWVKASPEITVDISEDIQPYLEYGEARTLFTCGYVQYTVAHPALNPDAASVAGIHSVISYYKDNLHLLGRDELLDKLVKLKEKGRLSGFIRRRVD